MKFVKGIVVGTAVATVVGMMYSEGMMNKKKIVKKCRRIAKRMGM